MFTDLYKNVIAATNSAVTVKLLDGGTAYCTIKIPIRCRDFDTCRARAKMQVANDLRKFDLIIWGEIVMRRWCCVDAVTCTEQDLMQSRMVFGENVVLFSGDCRYMLSVINEGSFA